MRTTIYVLLVAVLAAMVLMLGVVDLERYLGDTEKTTVSQSQDSELPVSQKSDEILEVEDLRRQDRPDTDSKGEKQAIKTDAKRFAIPRSQDAIEPKSAPAAAGPLPAEVHDEKPDAERMVKAQEKGPADGLAEKKTDKGSEAGPMIDTPGKEPAADLAALEQDKAITAEPTSGQPDKQLPVEAASAQPDKQPAVEAASAQPDKQPAVEAAPRQTDKQPAANPTYSVLDEAYPADQENKASPQAETEKGFQSVAMMEPEQNMTPGPSAEFDTGTRHPYSILLGIYKSKEKVEQARLSYQSRGLPAYWVRARLSQNTVQFRLLTGAFSTMRQAKAVLAQVQSPGAKVVVLEHACLVGIYKSKEQSLKYYPALFECDYYPHEIETESGGTRLYAGAYFTLEGARNNCTKLISKGFSCKVVER